MHGPSSCVIPRYRSPIARREFVLEPRTIPDQRSAEPKASSPPPHHLQAYQSTLSGEAFSGQALEGAGTEAHRERKSVATRLVELATERVSELWHDPDREPYATIALYGHFEHHPLCQRGFKTWLEGLYYTETGHTANAQAMQDALGVLSGKARFEGREYTVHTRLARLEGRLYLDLADKEWRVVEIDPTGWRVLARSPVKFRRPRGMLPLPVPVEGGNIAALRGYLNIDEGAWPLVLGWLTACYAPAGPYPVLILTAEQGSGKTTTARVLRSLIDPNVAPLRSEPRESRDLMIAARNGAVVMLDNLSRIPAQLSDDLCRLATGGGLGTRQLYSDDEETLFDATRPILITGIEDLADRGDLLDRAMIVGCPCIAEGERRTERELWAGLELDRPTLLGALLTAVSTGLRDLPHTTLPKLPRMADATLWVTACESGLGLKPGTFAAAYAANRRDANDLALDVSPIPGALRDLLAGRSTWEGTATELLADLDSRADERTQRLKSWPRTARALGNALRRLAPNLRAVGIEVEFYRAPKIRTRTIRITAQENVPLVPNVPPTSESTSQTAPIGGTLGGTQNEGGTQTLPQTSPLTARQGRKGDDVDKGDAKEPTRSNVLEEVEL